MKQLKELLKTEKNGKPVRGRHVNRPNQKTTANDDDCVEVVVCVRKMKLSSMQHSVIYVSINLFVSPQKNSDVKVCTINGMRL